MSLLQQNYQVVVEAYPEIAKKIKLHWGHQEFTDLVHELLNETRGHGREGFPTHVVDAFLTLQQLHDQVFPSMSEPTYGAKASAYQLSTFSKL